MGWSLVCRLRILPEMYMSFNTRDFINKSASQSPLDRCNVHGYSQYHTVYLQVSYRQLDILVREGSARRNTCAWFFGDSFLHALRNLFSMRMSDKTEPKGHGIHRNCIFGVLHNVDPCSPHDCAHAWRTAREPWISWRHFDNGPSGKIRRHVGILATESRLLTTTWRCRQETAKRQVNIKITNRNVIHPTCSFISNIKVCRVPGYDVASDMLKLIKNIAKPYWVGIGWSWSNKRYSRSSNHSNIFQDSIDDKDETAWNFPANDFG